MSTNVEVQSCNSFSFFLCVVLEEEFGFCCSLRLHAGLSLVSCAVTNACTVDGSYKTKELLVYQEGKRASHAVVC